MTTASAKKISEATSKALVSCPATDAVITLHALAAKLNAADTLIEQLSLQLTLAHYQYTHTLNQRQGSGKIIFVIEGPQGFFF